MEPVTFEPILKRIRWGGQKLGTILGKDLGQETDYAESWEIADHAAGQSRVSEGPYRGRSLSQLIQQHGPAIFGRAPVPECFPLLIKFLDANDWLSLQVHPNDTQAVRYQPNAHGKTEAWVIIDAEPDSQICAGLKSGVTREDLQEALQNGTVEQCLHWSPVQAGDCIFVPAGTVHAIGPGVLLAEVQQQSDLTFRLHDWGRTGSDGKPRELHLEEALDCTDFLRGPVGPSATATAAAAGDMPARETVISCDHFHIVRHRTDQPLDLFTNGLFRILMVLEGELELQTAGTRKTHSRGETILIPASCESFGIFPSSVITLLEIASGPSD